MQFKDIVGQQDVANRLTEIIDSGRISHAQHLLGSVAEGSLQTAWAYAQYLYCEHRQHFAEGGLRADSCGECPSCKKIASLQHPDLHLYFPTAGQNSETMGGEFRQFLIEHQGNGDLNDWLAYCREDGKLSQIYEADAASIVKWISMKSYEGGWKIFIVWMPEQMNKSAANEILKSLEEPTDNTLILLVGEDRERLLPTIRSRVQLVKMRSLRGRHDMDEAAAEAYAPMLVDWLRQLFKLRMKELSTHVDKMAALGRDQRKQMLTYALDMTRDCFLHTAAGLEVHIGSGDAKFDAMFPAMITPNNIDAICTAFSDAIFANDRNANAKIMLMELSFRLSKALKKR